MATEKLVDGDFLAKLVSGSYESAAGLVDEAVMAQAELFGGTDDSVSTLATFSEHMIVANEGGGFFRAKWAMNEDDEIEISDVEEIDVPIFEAGSMGVQVRDQARQATRLLMRGRYDEAGPKLRELYGLVRSGVRLTAEGVEDLYLKQTFVEEEWFQAVTEREQEIRGYLGVEALRLPILKPRFGALLDEDVDEAQAEQQRGTVIAALKELRGVFAKMRERIVLAKQVNEGYQIRGTEEGGMGVSDFVDFVRGYNNSLDSMMAITNDALAVSEDGCVKCLARLHDGIASQVHEWSLASALSEKLARRFDPIAA